MFGLEIDIFIKFLSLYFFIPVTGQDIILVHTNSYIISY
jgi:hypothetical protein